jgi:hypothetical protein
MPNLYRHRLLPALGAALLSQAVLIALLRPSTSTGRPAPSGQPNKPADDTPELLRLSRNLLQGSASATLTPGLSQLLALPLPPPPELAATPPPPKPQPGSAPVPCPPTSKAPQPTSSSSRPSAAQPSPQPSAPKPAASPLPGDLPAQPAQALELAKAIAAGRQTLPAEGASPAQVTLQRRQWWLSAQDSDQLQRAWDQAEVAEAPAAWGALPAGVQLRRVERQALGPLAAGDARGRSLLSREQITLLWGSGAQLWLLRQPVSGG